jgi:hypothetical protein
MTPMIEGCEYSYGAMDPAYSKHDHSMERNKLWSRRNFNADGTYRHGSRKIQPKTCDLNSEISYAINSARNTYARFTSQRRMSTKRWRRSGMEGQRLLRGY